MNEFQKKITWRVVGIHVAIIAVVWLFAVLPRCFTPKPKELVTFVVVGDPAPAVNVEPVSQLPAPEPPPERVPEPVKPKPKPKIDKPKPKPVKPKPKPKPTYTRPEDIKIGKKVNNTPTPPAVSSKDIQKALSDIVKTPTQKSGNPSEFAAYDAQVMRRFYGVWSRPAAPAMRPAEVRISVTKSGRITGQTLVAGSGDPAFDQTVMAAVRSVSTLPRPPAGYPDNFVVRFSIND